MSCLKVKTGSQKRDFAPWPVFEEDEIEAAVAVMRSGKVNYWTGDEVRFFEQEFAAYVGCRHGVAVANGTLALELALHSLGVGPGDEVIIPSRTFVATASAVVMRGAKPVVCDVDLDSQNLTVGTIAPLISEKTRAVIVVHLAGRPCDMDPILAVAKNHGLFVIEDCAQAHGATYKQRPVGSMGDVAAFSFCQDKIMTTAGEGGMVVTDRSDLWERAWSYKDHGKNYHTIMSPPYPGYRWVHDEFGTNWRLTAVQASVGRRQLEKLNAWVNQRRNNAKILDSAFRQLSALRVPKVPVELHHSYYKYYAFVRSEELRPDWNRDRILSEIKAAGVPCMPGVSSEIYREKAFANTELEPLERLPNAVSLGETSLMFMVHPSLTEEDIESTCSVVHSVMSKATS